MERKIRAYKNYFTDFITSLSEVEAKKVFFVLDMLKMQERLSAKFVKHIEDGISNFARSTVEIFSGSFLFLMKVIWFCFSTVFRRSRKRRPGKR